MIHPVAVSGHWTGLSAKLWAVDGLELERDG